MANAGSLLQPLDLEFRKLFWAARLEHALLKRNATVDAVRHKAAVNFARRNGWTWAEELLECSRLERIGKTEEALQLLAAKGPSVPPLSQNLVAFIRAVVLLGKGQVDDAIVVYREMLKDPNLDRPGWVWIGLGIAYYRMGQYDEAIAAYREALKDPNFEARLFVWNNLGRALQTKGQLDEAIAAYREAVKDPIFGVMGTPWNNLGTALEAKGQFNEAIKAYLNALKDPNYGAPARTWSNLGSAYSSTKKTSLAKRAYKMALSLPDTSGIDHKRARLGLSVLEGIIKAKALSPDDRALIENKAVEPPSDNPETRLINKLTAAGETQYERYLQKKDSGRDNTLSILRGWSSAVTLLEGSEGLWRGGGYFLKWQGCGIVIDPGFDFLREFHDAGFHGREISTVVVSHNHPDHNDDLKPIDDLRYELYNRLAGKSEKGCEPYVLLWDEDTKGAIKFSAEHPAHHHAPIVFPAGFPQPIDLSKHTAKLPVRIVPFRADHGNDVPNAMGVVIELMNKSKVALRIGYTGDTAFFEGLPEQLKNCDVVIVHISQPSREELEDAAKLKVDHLGYRGAIRLLDGCEPKLALVGEFWAGYADLRIDLVKGLRLRSKCKNILPAGLGMHLRLPSLEVECTQCGKPTPFSSLQVAPPADAFGALSYLCPECRL